MDDTQQQLLKQYNLRVTETRLQVLNVFQAAGQEALSSHAIEERLGQIDRITLYRTLKSFVEVGLIHEALDNTGKSKYALCNDHCAKDNHQHEHAHFHCTKCDKTTCLDKVVIPPITLPSNYQLEQKQLVLSGVCAACI